MKPAAAPPKRIPELGKLAKLREHRLRVAELELAAARAETDRRREAVAAADRRIEEVEQARLSLARWFEEQLDPRYVDAALARRELIVEQKAQAEAAREAACVALGEAIEAQAEAARAVARAKGKLDVAEDQLAAARRTREGLIEAAAELEGEDAAASRRFGPLSQGASA